MPGGNKPGPNEGIRHTSDVQALPGEVEAPVDHLTLEFEAETEWSPLGDVQSTESTDSFPVSKREISVTGAIVDGLKAVNRKADELIDKGMAAVGKLVRTAIKASVVGVPVYLANKETVDNAVQNAQEIITPVTSEATTTIVENVQTVTPAAQNVIPSIESGISSTANQVTEAANQIQQSAAPVVDAGVNQAVETYNSVADTVTPIVENAVNAGRDFIAQNGAEILNKTGEIALRTAEGAALGVVAVEGILLTREAIKAGATVTKEAFKTIANELDTGYDLAVSPGIETAISWAAGKTVGSTPVKAAAALFLEVPTHIGAKVASKVIKSIARVNDGIAELATRTANIADTVTTAFDSSRNRPTTTVEGINDTVTIGNPELSQAVDRLDQSGETVAANGLRYFDRGLRAIEQLGHDAREQAMQATQRASTQRNLANVVDAVIDIIPQFTTRALEARSQVLLTESANMRTAIAADLEQQYQHYSVDAVVDGAVQVVRDAARQGLENYKQDSIVYKVGTTIVQGVGRARRAVSQSVTNTVQGAQQLTANATQSTQQMMANASAGLANAKQAAGNAYTSASQKVADVKAGVTSAYKNAPTFKL